MKETEFRERILQDAQDSLRNESEAHAKGVYCLVAGQAGQTGPYLQEKIFTSFPV